MVVNELSSFSSSRDRVHAVCKYEGSFPYARRFLPYLPLWLAVEVLIQTEVFIRRPYFDRATCNQYA